MFDQVSYRTALGHVVAESSAGEVPELWMGPSGASLRFADTVVECPWNWYRGAGSMEGAVRDTWRVASWTSTKGAPLGIGFALTGALVEAARTLEEQTIGGWRAGTRLFHLRPTQKASSTNSGHLLLPFITLESVSKVSAQRDTLHALCSAVAEQPRRQALLGDPERASRLAEEMNATALRNHSRPVGAGWWVSRDEWQVWKALGRTAHAHRFGRPIAGEMPVPVQTLVAAVRQELATDPKARREIDGATLEQLLRSFHYDVEPRPFGAVA